MGKENSTPRPDPLNPNKRPDAVGAQLDSKSTSAGGEATLDTAGSATAAARALDRAIGQYILLRKLGEGGMGQVWLAEQTAPVRRQVALKLIRGGLYDAAMIHRFESERQSLAIMNHPAIAKVFDAGATKDGQPYFVMEHVDGLPITGYCDNKKLKMRERLQLFIKVCEGVQHAHQKAIIHRDLKPSNVLVTEVDGKPVPRIIDFGLAKAMTPQPGDEQSLFTQMGGLVGTRGFMSPEQADPAVLDVDTRTDVYSLGVILYVLLTGALPFDPEQWKKKPFDEVLRQLREEDPPSPSAKLGQEKDTAKDVAANRGTEPKQLIAALHGDLDWITMRAVEKDRARRYGTPSELSADIERYLENRPVVARPATTRYRLSKYVHRHRLGVAVAVSVAALLVAFAVTQAIQLRRITRERDRANRITDFMTGMFKVSDPSEAKGNTITAREILDKASANIDTSLTQDPVLQAQMMFTMGTVYDGLGLYPRAHALEQHAMEIQQRLLGPQNPDTLRSMGDFAVVLFQEGQYAKAENLNRELLKLRRAALGPENPDTLLAMDTLANIQWAEGRYSDAEKLERETLDIFRRVLGPDNPRTLVSMNNLANILKDEGHYAEAEKLRRDVLDADRRVLGPEHPQTLMSMNNLAADLHDEGHHAEAEKLERETFDIERRVLGPEHPSTIMVMVNLASELHLEGHDTEAEKLGRQTLEIERRVLGPEHPLTLSSANNLANVLIDEGRYAEAEKMDRTTLDIRRRIFGPEHPKTAYSTYNLACVLAHEGRRTEAFSLLREAVDHGLPPSADLRIDKDSDLKALHGDPRFTALVAHAKEVAAAAHKPNSANSK